MALSAARLAAPSVAAVAALLALDVLRRHHKKRDEAATVARELQELLAQLKALNKTAFLVVTNSAGDAFAAGFLFGWVGGGGQDGAAAAQSDRVCLGLSYGCAAGAAAVGQMGGSSPLPAEKVDSAMVLKPVTVEKRRAKTEPTRRHTVATPVRMGSARW